MIFIGYKYDNFNKIMCFKIKNLFIYDFKYDFIYKKIYHIIINKKYLYKVEY